MLSYRLIDLNGYFSSFQFKKCWTFYQKNELKQFSIRQEDNTAAVNVDPGIGSMTESHTRALDSLLWFRKLL